MQIEIHTLSHVPEPSPFEVEISIEKFKKYKWWENNIKMDLRERGWGGMDWIDLAQEGPCEHGNETSGSINVGKLLSGCATGGFSKRAQLHEVS
jgi:hypothetical protein